MKNNRNSGQTYRAGREAINALREAEAAFSEVRTETSAAKRVASFLCSKLGLTLMFITIGVATHLQQTQSFLNAHVFHSSKSATAVSLSDDAEESSDTDDGAEKPRTMIGARLQKASKSKQAINNHNSETIGAAEAILDGAE